MERHRSIAVGPPPGFTLLEILVVLVLIGLASALALPRIAGSLPGMQLKTSARKVVAVLRHARGRAVTEQRAFGVRFDPGRGMVAVQAADAANPHATGSLGAFALPDAVRLENPAGSPEGPFLIGFFPEGGSTGGQVVLSAGDHRRLRVTVGLITGEIAIADPAG